MVKEVAEVTRTATSLILSRPATEVTTPPDKEAGEPPLLCTQSYTLVKVGAPVSVEILTESYPPAGLPKTISQTSTLFIGLLKVYSTLGL